MFPETGGNIIAMKNRIRELRLRQDLTLQRLADRIGTTPQQIHRLERGVRRLSTEWMERVASGLGVHPTELIANEADLAMRSGAGDGAGIRVRELPAYGAIDLPVYGTAVGGSDTLLFNDGEVTERLARPALLAGAVQAYAVYMTGDSMEPRYRALELLYVNPARPVTAGCYAVVQKTERRSPGEAVQEPRRPRRRAGAVEPGLRDPDPGRGRRRHPPGRRVGRARLTAPPGRRGRRFTRHGAHPALIERSGSASASSVDRSSRRDAWSMSKPTTPPAASRSTFSPVGNLARLHPRSGPELDVEAVGFGIVMELHGSSFPNPRSKKALPAYP